MKKILYTAIIGNYDSLEPVEERFHDGWKLRCFTDQPINSDHWKIIQIDRGDIPAVAMARKIKILSHDYLPDAGVSIWVDANRKIKAPLDLIMKRLGHKDFICFRHPKRDCVYQEMEACLKYKKADPQKIALQRVAYLNQGIPSHLGLQYTGLLLRHHTERTIQINRLWWELMKEHDTWRDQLTLPLVFWKSKIDPPVLSYKFVGKFTQELREHKGIYAD
jgi:hypothetical protein